MDREFAIGPASGSSSGTEESAAFSRTRKKDEFRNGTNGGIPPIFFKECARVVESVGWKYSNFGSAQVARNVKVAETREMRFGWDFAIGAGVRTGRGSFTMHSSMILSSCQ